MGHHMGLCNLRSGGGIRTQQYCTTCISYDEYTARVSMAIYSSSETLTPQYVVSSLLDPFDTTVLQYLLSQGRVPRIPTCGKIITPAASSRLTWRWGGLPLHTECVASERFTDPGSQRRGTTRKLNDARKYMDSLDPIVGDEVTIITILRLPTYTAYRYGILILILRLDS